MFGLCMPEGEVYLLLKDGTRESIMLVDLGSPKKDIMTDKYVLEAVKRAGYENVESIVYERDSYKLKVSMADYYAERGQELEG